METSTTHTMLSIPAITTTNAAAFSPFDTAWNHDDDDTCSEYFNTDGSISDAAYEFLHHEWIMNRMS
jgi:hypothetical protein